MNTLIGSRNGFSLLEVAVAVALVTMVFTGVMALVTLSREAEVTNKHELIASHLAKEGMELVRQARDENYLAPTDPFNSIASTSDPYTYSFTIDYQGLGSIQSAASSDVRGADLFYIENGFYQNHGGPLVTPFRRLITTTYHEASSPDPAYIDVQVDVHWQIDTKERIYTLRGQLTDWR